MAVKMLMLLEKVLIHYTVGLKCLERSMKFKYLFIYIYTYVCRGKYIY